MLEVFDLGRSLRFILKRLPRTVLGGLKSLLESEISCLKERLPSLHWLHPWWAVSQQAHNNVWREIWELLGELDLCPWKLYSICEFDKNIFFSGNFWRQEAYMSSWRQKEKKVLWLSRKGFQHPLPAQRIGREKQSPCSPTGREPQVWKRQEDESQDDGPEATCQGGYSQVRPLRSLPLLLFQSPTPWELDLENQWELG